jgi:predicted N-acetyltransferase YhbS
VQVTVVVVLGGTVTGFAGRQLGLPCIPPVAVSPTFTEPGVGQLLRSVIVNVTGAFGVKFGGFAVSETHSTIAWLKFTVHAVGTGSTNVFPFADCSVVLTLNEQVGVAANCHVQVTVVVVLGGTVTGFAGRQLGFPCIPPVAVSPTFTDPGVGQLLRSVIVNVTGAPGVNTGGFDVSETHSTIAWL